MRTKFLLFILILLLSSGCSSTPKNYPAIPNYSFSHKLQAGEKIIYAELAETIEKQSQGLSGQKSITDQQGMLFLFPEETSPNFWMKGMNFSLDIIWISKNKIIYISKNIPIPTIEQVNNKNIPTYSPPSKVDAVLEVNSGWSEKNNLQIGDEVKLLETK